MDEFALSKSRGVGRQSNRVVEKVKVDRKLRRDTEIEQIIAEEWDDRWVYRDA